MQNLYREIFYFDNLFIFNLNKLILSLLDFYKTTNKYKTSKNERSNVLK